MTKIVCFLSVLAWFSFMTRQVIIRGLFHKEACLFSTEGKRFS